MEFWATHNSMSSRTLARLFRRELNMSCQEWQSQLLLLEAQIRLAEGRSSSSVAKSLGYDSHAAFCAMFRKAIGVSPSEHRGSAANLTGQSSAYLDRQLTPSWDAYVGYSGAFPNAAVRST